MQRLKRIEMIQMIYIRVLWSSQFVNRPPINFIHVDGNHYVALLPYYDDTMLNQRYSYQGRLMSDVEHQAFRTRLLHQIPPNEVVDEDQGDIWID